MKKQYLISLLGITAISISLGNSFSSVLAPSHTVNEESSNMVSNSMSDDIDLTDEYFSYSIEQVSMGSNHSAAVVTDGEDDHLYTWGVNDYGQLGLGDDFTEYEYNTPQEVVFVDGAKDIAQISMGQDHSAAIVDGDLYTWGDNTYGQLGLGTESTNEIYYTSPQAVTAFSTSDVEKISLGVNNSAAIVDNNLYTWGNNDTSQLGLGDDLTANKYYVPQKVESLPTGTIEQLSLGYKTGGVVISEGGSDSLYTWGYNAFGQLGYENRTNDPKEVTFDGAEDIEQISMGGNHSGAIVDNKLYTWGRNTEGQLGLGTADSDSHSSPKEVASLTKEGTVEQISMGTADTMQRGFSSAIINDGSTDHLYTWGYNGEGQLGYAPDGTTINPIPKEVTDGLPTGDIKQVSEGLNDTAIIVNDGNKEYLYTWGVNDYGQLGLGEDFTDGNYSAPNEVWGTPYVDTINSSVTLNEDNPGEVAINYDFQTNLNVQDVTIDISSADELVEPQTITSVPSFNEGKYSGEETFSGLFGEPETTEYTYTISLNYLTHDGSSKTSVIAEATFEPFDATAPSTIEAIYVNDEVTINGTNSASVDYKVTPGKDAYDHSLTVTKVQWMNGGKEIASSADEAGTLTAKELFPNTTYDKTTIIATMSDGTKTDELLINSFKTDPCDVVDSTINQDGDVSLISPTEASVKYEIKAGSNEDGTISTVSEVRWIDGYGTDDEVILATNDDGNLIGTLTTKDLKPHTPYANTSIVATMSYGEPITASIEEFTTDDADELSTIKVEEVTNIGQTTASVDYAVTPGADVWGIPVTVDTVQWIDHNDNDKVIASSTTQTGTLEATDLTINTKYDNTTVVATMNDSSTAEASIGEFKTNAVVTNSTLDSTKVDSQTQNSVTVSYEVTLGTKLNGDEATVISAMLYEDADTTKAFTNQNTNDDGTITVSGLEANATYPDATLKVIFSNEAEPQTKAVADFKTDDAYSASTLDSTKVESQTQNSVIISYEATLGHDLNGDDAIVESAILYEDADTTVEFATQKQNDDGTITVSGLEANATYPDATLKVIFSNEAEPQTKAVADFKTKPVVQESTVTATIDESKTTTTSVTFDYVAVNGVDADGDDYWLQEIKIVDANDPNTILASEKAADGEELPSEGSIIVNDLDPNTTYDLEMIAVFVDVDGVVTEKDTEEPIPPVTTSKDGLGALTISGIIIMSIFLIIIIFGASVYLLKKYKASKS